MTDVGSRVAPATRCGAATRQGRRCLARPVRGKNCCRLHGGASTGPRTQEGRDRVAEAQRRRWAAIRHAQYGHRSMDLNEAGGSHDT